MLTKILSFGSALLVALVIASCSTIANETAETIR